ncbi:NUDIX hydrolase [Hyphomicrobium sp. DY-1]|uniref:NUDIX hydrolase n=1 Tax=Hyphomicrobium sp. DY-1 TaxID=3075650 RepID=UPI0039C0E4E5
MFDRRLPSSVVAAESLAVDVRQYAVVTDQEGRLLVLQYPPLYEIDARNRWTLPGGALLRKEDPRAGIFRELSEQTGLEPELGLHVRVHRGVRRAGLWVFYRGFAVETAVKLSPEHQGVAWVGGDEFRDLPFFVDKLKDVAAEMLLPDRVQWLPSAAKRSMIPIG